MIFSCDHKTSAIKKPVKWGVVVLLIGFLFLIECVSYVISPHYSSYVRVIKKYYLQKTIDRSRIYFDVYDQPVMTDEYILSEHLWPQLIDPARRKFGVDPFDRLLGEEHSINDFTVERLADDREQVQDLVEIFGDHAEIYHVDDKWQKQLTTPYDRALLRALYCDRNTYDRFDLDFLRAHADHAGGYGDTHYAMGLIMLRRLGCVHDEEIASEIDDVARRIMAATEQDEIFSDLYAERIVTLYWLGHGDHVIFPWIMHIARNQKGDGGFWDRDSSGSNPHTTALATLAIKYFLEGDSVQSMIAQ